MTASQRRHLYSGLMLGVAVTVLVTVLDAAGFLSGVENQMYNERARWCQVFAPPPTTQLVHLDIDDAALEEVGRWPWDRTKLGDVIGELAVLGARVVAMDIIMPEPQEKVTRRGVSGELEEVDHDVAMAAAVKRSGEVLVPVSLEIKAIERPTAARVEAARAFEAELELPLAEARSRVAAVSPTVTDEDLINGRRDAVEQRVRKEIAAGTGGEEIVRRLMPKSGGGGGKIGTLRQTVEFTIRQEESRATLSKLVRADDGKLPDVLRATSALLPVPALAREAGYTGFVDRLPFSDGVVRAVPLWIEERGTLYPQLGLSMACAMLGVPVKRVGLAPGRVTVPRPDGGNVVIPVSSYDSPTLKRRVGTLMMVPWFGTARWETMYDWPLHKTARQHIPATVVWQAARGRKLAAENNRVADHYLKLWAGVGLDSTRKFLENPPEVSGVENRFEVIRAAIEEIDRLGYVKAYREMKPEELKEEDQDLLKGYDDLKRVVERNQGILQAELELRTQFAGKAVLIGSVASGAADFVSTPLHAQCPGAVVHGAVFNAVMTGNVWTAVPGWVNVLVTVGMGLLVTVAVAWVSPWKALVAMGVIVGGYLGINGYVVFDWGKHILGAAGPVVAAGGVWGVVTVTRYIVERAEGERVRGRFRSYVDEQLVDYVLENPGGDIFEGEEHELTVAFTDMKGFTSLMERLGKRIVPVMNEYMGRMVPIIQDNRGVVNKFLGDGIMFFYAVPRPNHDHAADAVTTVLEMQVAVRKFNDWLDGQGLEHVAVRAGVTTGFMVVGDAGTRKRADYTVLGDSVNLASRLESANKYLGTAVMISERTRELLDGRFVVRPVGRIRVVGKTAWVMAYEPMARTGEESGEQREMVDVTKRMVDAFIAGDFAACEAAAEEAIARFGAQRLFEMYLKLARTNRAEGVGEGFDGVVELSEK